LTVSGLHVSLGSGSGTQTHEIIGRPARRSGISGIPDAGRAGRLARRPDQVMADAAGLVEIRHTLRQIVNVKGE
jgi:hypothetical protein